VIDVLLSRSSRISSNTRSINNGATLNLHFGSARIPARVQLRDCRELLPNDNAIVRLRLAEPVGALVGDHFIVRDAAERQTVAGGVVLDATPEMRKFRAPEQRRLLDQRALAPNEVKTLLRTQLERDGFKPRLELARDAPFSEDELAIALEELHASANVLFDQKIAVDAGWWKSSLEAATKLIDAEHAAHPERPGLELNRLREGLDFTDADLFSAFLRLLTREGFGQLGNIVRRTGFRPSLPSHLQAAGDRIRAMLDTNLLDPPARKDLTSDRAAARALRFLCETGELVVVSEDLIMRADGVATMKARIEEQLRVAKKATVSELRQATGSTRRVMVPLLEYFDRIGLTKRVGDSRMLR
jgi:selenocysteine-specific elongation factor